MLGADNQPVDYKIPAWCRLPLAEHYDGLGGCWGIRYGYVREQGETYCQACEYRRSASIQQAEE